MKRFIRLFLICFVLCVVSLNRFISVHNPLFDTRVVLAENTTYKDPISGMTFTVPNGYSQVETPNSSERYQAHFINDEDANKIILFGCLDQYENGLSEEERKKFSRKQNDFSYFTDKEVMDFLASSLSVDSEEFTTVTYSGVKYYRMETYSEGIDMNAVFMFTLVNGYFYSYYATGTPGTSNYQSLATMLRSVEFPWNTSSQIISSGESVFDMINTQSLLISLGMTFVLHLLPIIIYRFWVKKRAIEASTAKIIVVVQGIILFVLYSFLNRRASGSSIVLWGWIGYGILKYQSNASDSSVNPSSNEEDVSGLKKEQIEIKKNNSVIDLDENSNQPTKYISEKMVEEKRSENQKENIEVAQETSPMELCDESMLKCPYCQQQLEKYTRYCPYCNAPLYKEFPELDSEFTTSINGVDDLAIVVSDDTQNKVTKADFKDQEIHTTSPENSEIKAKNENVFTVTLREMNEKGLSSSLISLYSNVAMIAIVVYVLLAIAHFVGLVIIPGYSLDDTKQFFDYYPTYRNVSLIYGFYLLIIAVNVFRFKVLLNKFKADAPAALITVIILNMIGVIGHNILMSMAVPREIVVDTTGLLITGIVHIAFAAINMVYFNHRKSFFTK